MWVSAVFEKTCTTNQKNVKGHFLILKKNIRKHTYSFRGHVISLVFNTQLPEVRNVDVVFTFTRNYQLRIVCDKCL